LKAKEYLRQYEDLNRIAEQHREEYEIEMEKIDAIGSTLAGEPGMPHGTGISRKTEDKAIRLADKAMKWKMAELDALEKRQEIYELISQIKGVEGDVLYQRYIRLRKWEEICVLVHMSWNGTHKAHRRALIAVQIILDKSG
jgi:hypothetical protein